MKNLFKNKKVTVMGIGLHGGAIETIKWLISQGAKVIATDKKSEKELWESLKKLKQLKNLKIVAGQHRLEDFNSVDMVVKNPAVPWNNKYIKVAIEKNIPVEMDSSLFFNYCQTENVIGITGTKGKTTTSLLIAHILETSGIKTTKVGIGQEPVMNKLSQIQSKNDWVVFELSSWRLSALKDIGKSPKIAVVTNIFPDHMNYYKDMASYIGDKENIFRFQKEEDVLLLNSDNAYSKDFKDLAKGYVGFFGFNKQDENICVFVENDEIRYNIDGNLGKICSVKDVPLRGSHNLHNVLAASLVVLLVGVAPKNIAQGIKSFTSVPHRLELVLCVDGVSYFNDTTATTPEAAITAIRSFSKPITLICGGADKNLELDELCKEISNNNNVGKIVFLKGTATGKLERLVKDHNGWDKVVGSFDDFAAAVEAARQNSVKGSIVLLSPGCASFGMFKNEFDRGDQFRELVKKLQI